MTRPMSVNRFDVRRLLTAPFRGRTYRHLAYLLLMFPLGTLYFALLSVGVGVGVPLLVVGIGFPVLLAVLVLVVELTRVEQRLLRLLLDVEIPDPEPQTEGSAFTRAKQFVTDIRVWKGVGYLVSVFVVGSATVGLLTPLLATAGSFLLAPLYYRHAPVVAYGPISRSPITLDLLFGWDNLLVGLSTTFRLGAWHVETLPGALFVAALGAMVLVALVVIADAVAMAWARYARYLLPVPRYWSWAIVSR